MDYIRMEYKKDTPWGRHMSGDKSIAIGAKDNGELVAYAVYTTQEKESEYIVLDYIYVVPKWRKKYIASNLLEYVETKLRVSGYRYIVCRILAQEGIDCKIYNLLNVLGFCVYKDDTMVLEYQLSKVEIAERMEKIRKLCITGKRSVQIGRKNDSRYLRFMEEMYHKGIDMYSVTFDCNKSFFYQDKDEQFQGCILVEKRDSKAEIKYFYINESKIGQSALLGLFCDAVGCILGNDEKINMTVYLTSQKYKDLFLYFFPDSQMHYNIVDCVRQL